jgi:hypothetical protein
MARGAADALHGDLSGLGRAGAIATGLGAAVAGYLVGLGSRRTRPLLAKARSAATARAR